MSNAISEHERQILEQFTQQAEPFALAASHSTEDSLRTLLDTAGVNEKDEALDVACGPGIVACALASVARHVTGLDLVPAMLEQARKLQSEKGLQNLTWQLGNVTSLPFDEQSFSLVVTRYSFHHLLDPGAALREMARVARRGGRVLVADVTPEASKSQAYDRLETLRDPSHAHALSLEELKALGAGAGLSYRSTAAYRLDVNVDELLRDSFPAPGNAGRFRDLVRADVGVNRLSIDAYEKEGALRFRFPVSVVVWSK
jgi:ubiquinone/menaquinone biosynthesis C-methylase UbiE